MIFTRLLGLLGFMYIPSLLFADTEKYFQKEDANKFSFFLLSYFFIFLVSSIIYHNAY